jgi:glucose-1-phosphate thymidylyltransferase
MNARKGIIFVDPARAGALRSAVRRLDALQPVANRPIVCHAIEALRAAEVSEVAVAVPDTAVEDVRRCIAAEGVDGIDVHYLPYVERAGAGQAVRAAAESVAGGPCILHAADGLVAQSLAPFADPFDHDAAADVTLLVHRGAPEQARLGEMARRVLRIAQFEPDSGTIGLAGVCVFAPGGLQRACHGGEFAGDHVDPISLAERLATAGGRMQVRFVRGWRRYEGEVMDLLELNRFTLDQIASDYTSAHQRDNQIEGRVVIDATARISSSIIVGPVIIGPRAVVRDAYVGPYSAIGSDARIDSAEIERSIISSTASVTHVGDRLVASVIGPGTRVFRDFSLPRGLRLQIGEDMEVALP